MELIRTYFIRIAAMALICGSLGALCRKTAMRNVLRLCGALCLAAFVLQPLLKIDLTDVVSRFASLQTAQADLTAQAEQTRYEQTSALIKEQTRAYILDKAAACHVQASVEVQTSPCENGLCVPSGVTLRANVTPQQQQELTTYIMDTFAVPGDCIRWIEDN